MTDTPPNLSPEARGLLQLRARYRPALAAFLAELDNDGLSDVVRAGRTRDTHQVVALSRRNIVSSAVVTLPDDVFRLRFTKVGRSIRKLLLAEAAHA